MNWTLNYLKLWNLLIWHINLNSTNSIRNSPMSLSTTRICLDPVSSRPIGGPTPPTTIASVSDVVLLWTRDLAFWKKPQKWLTCFFLERFCQTKIHGMALMEPGYLGEMLFMETGYPNANDFGEGRDQVFSRSLFGHSRIEFAPVAAGHWGLKDHV